MQGSSFTERYKGVLPRGVLLLGSSQRVFRRARKTKNILGGTVLTLVLVTNGRSLLSYTENCPFCPRGGCPWNKFPPRVLDKRLPMPSPHGPFQDESCGSYQTRMQKHGKEEKEDIILKEINPLKRPKTPNNKKEVLV